MPAIHYTILEKGGKRYTACSRINPAHSTASFWGSVTCATCLKRVTDLSLLPRLNQDEQMKAWVRDAERRADAKALSNSTT